MGTRMAPSYANLELFLGMVTGMQLDSFSEAVDPALKRCLLIGARDICTSVAESGVVRWVRSNPPSWS